MHPLDLVVEVIDVGRDLHIAIVPSITIRDVPPETRDKLAARAARAAGSGQSLQKYLRSQLIKLARHPTNDEIFERAAEWVRRTGTGLTTEQILAAKYADRAEQERELDRLYGRDGSGEPVDDPGR